MQIKAMPIHGNRPNDTLQKRKIPKMSNEKEKTKSKRKTIKIEINQKIVVLE